MMSVVLRIPDPGAAGGPPRPDPGLLPLVTGVAVANGVRRVTGLAAVLKWPNDVMLANPDDPTELAKFAGILAEADPVAGAVVVGMGINVSITAADLPAPGATSLLLAGVQVPRGQIIAAVLGELARGYDQWAAGQSVIPAYQQLCATLGREVEVSTPAGLVVGQVVDVGPAGELVVAGRDEQVRLLVGDVTHVRHGQH